MTRIDPGLEGVPETLLWTLYHRALEARRPDAVLHDPAASLHFETDALAHESMLSIQRAMRDPGDRAVHDPERLRVALRELIAPPATSRAAG